MKSFWINALMLACIGVTTHGVNGDCDRPTNLQDNVVITPDQSSYGTYYSFTPSCESGYDVSGPTTFYCTAGSPDYWDPNPSLTVCIAAAQCSKPNITDPEIVISPDKDIYDAFDVITFNCSNGGDIEGSDSSTCQGDGTWSYTSEPYCPGSAQCPKPNITDPVIIITPDKDIYDPYDVITFNCSDGGDIMGLEVISCKGDGTWSYKSEPFCVAQCNASANTNGTGIYEYGEEVIFVCDPGYELPWPISSITATCNDGNWSPPFECHINFCPRPTNLQPNVVITPDQSTYETWDTYTASCELGYDVSGPTTFYCYDGGSEGDYWHSDPSSTVCTGSEVICDSTTMTIIVDRELVGAGTPAGDVHLDDETCIAYDYDAKHIALSTTYDDCLTTYKTTNNTVTYLNSVTYRVYQGPSSGLISRDKTMHIPVSCELERTQVLHSAFVADVDEVQSSEEGFGNYSLTLDRYTDQFFNESVVDLEVEVALGDPLFFAVHLETVSGFIVFMKRCWATPSANPNDAKSYIFLDNGCTEDETMVLMSPFNSSTQTFRIDAFSFIEENPEVYIHCESLVCDNDPSSRCAKGCLPRHKRRGQQTGGILATPRILSVGPISSRGRKAADPPMSVNFIESADNHGNIETIDKSSPLTNYLHIALIGGGVGIACLLLGMGAMFLLIKRHYHRGRSGYRYEEVVDEDDDIKE